MARRQGPMEKSITGCLAVVLTIALLAAGPPVVSMVIGGLVVFAGFGQMGDKRRNPMNGAGIKYLPAAIGLLLSLVLVAYTAPKAPTKRPPAKPAKKAAPKPTPRPTATPNPTATPGPTPTPTFNPESPVTDADRAYFDKLTYYCKNLRTGLELATIAFLQSDRPDKYPKWDKDLEKSCEVLALTVLLIETEKVVGNPTPRFAKVDKQFSKLLASIRPQIPIMVKIVDNPASTGYWEILKIIPIAEKMNKEILSLVQDIDKALPGYKGDEFMSPYG